MIVRLTRSGPPHRPCRGCVNLAGPKALVRTDNRPSPRINFEVSQARWRSEPFRDSLGSVANLKLGGGSELALDHTPEACLNPCDSVLAHCGYPYVMWMTHHGRELLSPENCYRRIGTDI